MKKILICLLVISFLGASCTIGKTTKVGIIKTANGGVDWQPANKIVNNDKTLLARSISQLKFSNNGDKIFASSFDGGLYSTEDAGENWTEVLGGVIIYDFAIDPSDDKNMYAASYMGDRGRLIVTHDSGKTWTEVYSDAGSKNPVRAVAINPNNPSDVMIGMGKGSVIQSSDSGNSWRLVNNYNDRINRIHWQSNSEVYIVVQKTGIFKSTDNGTSFTQISKSLVVTSDASKPSIFGTKQVNDYRQLAIDPSNPSTLWLTTNKGLFESMDGGIRWNYVSMPFRQQDASPFAVAVAPSSSSVLYVSSNYIMFKSVDGGLTWSSSNTNTNGLITSLLISRDLPQVAFAGVSK
jgi:photosystem II stability/assembly factor-like uncharacterized protein